MYYELDDDTEARALRMPVGQGVCPEESPDTTLAPTLPLLPKYGPVNVVWRDGQIVARCSYRLVPRPLTLKESLVILDRILADQPRAILTPMDEAHR